MFISVVNKFCIIIVLVLVISKNITFSKPADNKQTSTLKLVALLHRHGDRTPAKFYQNDPYKDKKYWPLGPGQLTLKGKKQLYKLGKTLRTHYKSFIDKFTVESVRVNSSDELRCHMSAGALLAGMFPPEKDQIWTEELNWQPIPIHSVPKSTDRIIALWAPCAKYDVEVEKVITELAEQETLEDKQLYKYLTDHMGENVSKLSKVGAYYKTLLLEESSGFTLPVWTKGVYPDIMKKKAAIDLSCWSWNKFLQRISGGPMIKEVITQFKEKSNGGNKDMKLFLYSGHETTIIAVWNALQFKELLMPDFGASLIFELHQSSSDYIVKMFFMNSTDVTEPYELNIPECSAPCHLDTFYQITEYMRNVDWDTDCVID